MGNESERKENKRKSGWRENVGGTVIFSVNLFGLIEKWEKENEK